MKNMRLYAIGFAIVVLTAAGYAQGPQLISYQGKLMNSSGVPLASGTYDMTFSIYNVETGGSAIWTEAHTGGNAVSVTGGYFNAILGGIDTSGNPLRTWYFASQGDLWLEVVATINSVNETFTRTRLVSAPSAITLVPGASIIRELGTANLYVGNGDPGGLWLVAKRGIWAQTNDGTAIEGDASSGTGLYGYSGSGTGVRGSSNSGTGVYGSSSSGYGIQAVGNSYPGIYADSDSHWSGWFANGIRVNGSDWHGIEISGAGWAGIYIHDVAYAGIEANGNAGDGAYGSSLDPSSAGKAGVRGLATGGWYYGVLGQDGSGSDSGYALRTRGYPNFTDVNGDARINDDLYVDGTCVGCGMGYLAQNADAEALEPGDVVVISGLGEQNAALSCQRPILNVRKGTLDEKGSTLLAVVLEGAPPKSDTGVANNGTTRDYVPSGGYLTLATAGQMARLKVEAAGDAVQVGDALTGASGAIYAVKAKAVVVEGVKLYAQDSIIGRALEPVKDGIAEIWVLLTFK